MEEEGEEGAERTNGNGRARHTGADASALPWVHLLYHLLHTPVRDDGVERGGKAAGEGEPKDKRTTETISLPSSFSSSASSSFSTSLLAFLVEEVVCGWHGPPTRSDRLPSSSSSSSLAGGAVSMTTAIELVQLVAPFLTASSRGGRGSPHARRTSPPIPAPGAASALPIPPDSEDGARPPLPRTMAETRGEGTSTHRWTCAVQEAVRAPATALRRYCVEHLTEAVLSAYVDGAVPPPPLLRQRWRGGGSYGSRSLAAPAGSGLPSPRPPTASTLGI